MSKALKGAIGFTLFLVVGLLLCLLLAWMDNKYPIPPSKEEVFEDFVCDVSLQGDELSSIDDDFLTLWGTVEWALEEGRVDRSVADDLQGQIAQLRERVADIRIGIPSALAK